MGHWRGATRLVGPKQIAPLAPPIWWKQPFTREELLSVTETLSPSHPSLFYGAKRELLVSIHVVVPKVDVFSLDAVVVIQDEAGG